MLQVKLRDRIRSKGHYIMLIKFEDNSTYLAKIRWVIQLKTVLKELNWKLYAFEDIPVGINIHVLKFNQVVEVKLLIWVHQSISGLDGNYSLIKLASGEVRKIDSRSLATIGVLSNPDQKNIKIGKAGRSRWLGRRPHTRGVVKNPIDHPHGW